MLKPQKCQKLANYASYEKLFYYHPFFCFVMAFTVDYFGRPERMVRDSQQPERKYVRKSVEVGAPPAVDSAHKNSNSGKIKIVSDRLELLALCENHHQLRGQNGFFFHPPAVNSVNVFKLFFHSLLLFKLNFGEKLEKFLSSSSRKEDRRLQLTDAKGSISQFFTFDSNFSVELCILWEKGRFLSISGEGRRWSHSREMGIPKKRGERALRWRTNREWHDWILAVVKVVSRQGPMIDESVGDERKRTRSKLNHTKAAEELFKYSRWRRCKMNEICSEDGTIREKLQWNFLHSFIIYQFVTKTFMHCIRWTHRGGSEFLSAKAGTFNFQATMT